MRHTPQFSILTTTLRDSYVEDGAIIPMRAIKKFIILFDLTGPSSSNHPIDFNSVFIKNITLYHYGFYKHDFFVPYNSSLSQNTIITDMNTVIAMETRYLSRQDYDNVIKNTQVYVQQLRSAVHVAKSKIYYEDDVGRPYTINEHFFHSYYTRIKLLKRQRATQNIIDATKDNNGPFAFAILMELDGNIEDPHKVEDKIYPLLYYVSMDDPNNLKEIRRAFYAKAHIFNFLMPMEVDILDFY